MTELPNQRIALHAIEKALALLQVQTLEPTDIESIKHLLEVAVVALKQE